MNDKKYSVAIIGCGSIGALKPDEYDYPGGPNILTHAHAFWKHPRIGDILFMDDDRNKSKQAAKKWAGITYNSGYFGHLKDYDIIVLAVPTQFHKEYLIDFIGFGLKPKLVICEKPFCMNSKESKEIIQLYAYTGIPLAVNYQRLYERNLVLLSNKIKNKELRVESIIVRYGRGIRHDGSHALMQIRSFFRGSISDDLIFDISSLNQSFDDSPYHLYGDKSVSFIIEVVDENQKIPVIFFAHNSKDYNIFEIEVVTDKGIYTYPLNGSVEVFRPIKEEKTYGSYKVIGGMHGVEDWDNYELTSLNQSLLYAVDHYVKFLDGSIELYCPGFVAHETNVLIDQILSQKVG